MNTDIDNVCVLAVEANLCVCKRSSQTGLFLSKTHHSKKKKKKLHLFCG